MSASGRTGDRTVLHTVHADNDWIELYWTRGEDDFPTLGGDQFSVAYNSAMFTHEGQLIFKAWTDGGVDGGGEPYVLVIDGNRVLVVNSEDMVAPEPDDPHIVFDSALIQSGPEGSDGAVYTVTGTYGDNGQRYATSVRAVGPEEAEVEAIRVCREDNDDESIELNIAAVINAAGTVVA